MTKIPDASSEIEICPNCHGSSLYIFPKARKAECQDCGYIEYEYAYDAGSENRARKLKDSIKSHKGYCDHCGNKRMVKWYWGISGGRTKLCRSCLKVINYAEKTPCGEYRRD